MRTLSHEELEELDLSLSAEAVPIHERALEIFKRTYGSVRIGAERDLLFEPLTAWYAKKDGSDAIWNGIIGHFPLLIRGKIYLGKARFVSEDTVEDFKEGIENLSDEVGRSLTRSEIELVTEKQAICSGSYCALLTCP